MLSRPPATVSGAIGPAPPTRSPISFPSRSSTCIFADTYDIMRYYLYGFFFGRELWCPLLFYFSPSLFSSSLSTKYLYIFHYGAGLAAREKWLKIPILIAGQKGISCAAVPQDRLPVLHIYVRNIVDTSSSLCCATWRTTYYTSRSTLLPISKFHEAAAAAETLELRIPCKELSKEGCPICIW